LERKGPPPQPAADPGERPERGERKRIVIRAMTFDDLAAVFHLGERLFTSRDAPNLYRTWDEYEVMNLYQEDQETCAVATVDGKLAGFVLGTTVSKARSAWKYGYLVWLAVEPGHQRAGLATRLFQHFRAQVLAQGVRMLMIDTAADNHSALAFFGRMGFGNPEPHVYMTQNLAAEQRALKVRREDGHGPGGRDG
jgi:ribosomal protein S18 acetylase RimI-like enzyme